MSTDNEYKSPEELEREIDETRVELDETLGTLRNRVAPGALLDYAVDYLRHGPKDYAMEFGGNLSRSVRDNPLALGLVGAGVTWLMLGNSHRPEEPNYGDEDFDYYADADMEAATDLTAPDYSATQYETGDAASGDGRWDAAKRKAAAGKAELSAKASRLRDSAGGQARRARQTMSSARARGRHYRERAGYEMRRARSGAADMYHEHPLVLGALGIAVGALIAAAVPATRREDEWLGETRDELLDDARARAEDGLEAGRRAVHAAGESAREEAERQGLSAAAAEDAVRAAGNKVKHVAESAGEAAKAEVQRDGGTDGSSDRSAYPPPSTHH